MADSKQAPLDAEAAAKAAFASVQNQPFPNDIFTAPELRWAVIGCGVIANQMAQSLALAGRKLAGVANRTLSKAQAFAEQHGVEKVYGTVEDLYADPDIDAVYITTPHNTHITYLRAALAAGKHVLCEKAITLNSAELDEAPRHCRRAQRGPYGRHHGASHALVSGAASSHGCRRVRPHESRSAQLWQL